jgi:hypothetical protein
MPLGVNVRRWQEDFDSGSDLRSGVTVHCSCHYPPRFEFTLSVAGRDFDGAEELLSLKKKSAVDDIPFVLVYHAA